MYHFLQIISPSLQYKIIIIKYERVLKDVKFFSAHDALVDDLLKVIEITFMAPQQVIVEQQDLDNKHLYITGAGRVVVYKQVGNTVRKQVDEFGSGHLINMAESLFDGLPSHST